jgi:hypothetical protein
MSVGVMIPIVVLFFCAGIFVGSRFVGTETTTTQPAPKIGLPGTNNKFAKWATGEGGNQFLRTVSHHDAPASDSLAAKISAAKKNLKGPPTANTVNDAAPFRKSESVAQPDFIPAEIPVKVVPLNRERSLHATRQSYMTAPAGLDNSDILIAAWIYLDDTAVNDNDMRTVFSNKLPGCGTTQGNYGLSVFVNAWQSNDHKLYIEYGGQTSGCHKVDSGSVQIQHSRWYHVGLYASPTTVTLYVDGVATNTVQNIEPHEVQGDNPFYVGVYDGTGEYPFYGNISTLAVRHNLAAAGVDPTSAVKELQGQTVTSSLYALYTLTDAAEETANSVAREAVNGRNGKYTFPLHKSTVSGVNIALVDGVGGREVTDAMRQQSDKEARERRESVKAGMRHAWSGYKRYAWGRDEVKPISNHGQDNWGGMGVTLVDSLDTLWLMGLKEEFAEARDWVANSLSFDHAGTVSVFETTIRELGGLLSAYDLSQDRVFLDKARQLADKLTPAFNTESGIPMGMVNFRNGQASGGWSGSNAILSELGSVQLEFRYLAEKVKDTSYEQKSMRPFQVMYAQHPSTGLYPIKVSTRDGRFAETQVTFGALGDSFYEYLLKVWLQGGRKETWLREMYDKAMDGVMDKLLLASDVSGLAFLSDWNGRHNNRKMDHLVCFMPGTLALGAYTDPKGLNSARAQRDLAVAKALMYTCYQMYHRMASGIAAEYVEFPAHQDFIPGPQAQFYILRPETAESLFVLNKLTGDPIYRDWAWEIWQAIDRTCKTDTAYGAIRDVTKHNGGGIDDRMESFFLAETLKYLYLAQDPDTEIDLMKFVFNTEAHPMRLLDASHTPARSG